MNATAVIERELREESRRPVNFWLRLLAASVVITVFVTVSPLSVRQLVRGRFWGMVCHYSPAFAILTVCWFGNRALNPRSSAHGLWHWMWPNPFAFGAMMALGFYLSLTRMNFLLAGLLTWVVAFLAPVLLAVLLETLDSPSPFVILAGIAALLMMLGTAAWVLLSRNLQLRSFLR